MVKEDQNQNEKINYINIEGEADLILKLAGVERPPVPIEAMKRISQRLDFTIDLLNFNEEALGFSFPDAKSGKWRILINKNLVKAGARRYTFFHEFHHILKSEVGFSKLTPEGKLIEHEADYFAAFVLMPARWVKRYWNKYRDINTLAKIFGVSRKAMGIRIKNLDHYLSI